MLLPCEDTLLRNVVIERPAYRVGRYDNLPFDQEKALFAILVQEICL